MKINNWRTTVAGVLVGLIPAIQGVSQTIGSGGSVQWYPLQLGIGIMGLGVLAKDAATKDGEAK